MAAYTSSKVAEDSYRSSKQRAPSRRRRVARRPQEGAPGRCQERGGGVAEEVGAGRPEAHHRDVGAEPRHGQPLDALADVEVTAASFADGFNTSEVAGVNGVNTVACSGSHTP